MKRRNRPPEPKSGADDSDIMTLQEVAEFLDCSYAMVLLQVMRNGLLTFRIGDGRWVRRSDLAKWIKDRKTAPAERGPKGRPLKVVKAKKD
jgi:hypothetical protein